MNIIPAIDLRNSQCVRLYKGDFAQQTTYADAPILIAKQFEALGAEFIHIVDLDGAKNQQATQTKIIEQITKDTNLRVQTGGGIRNTDQIAKLLDNGVDRVVIGSVAVKEPTKIQNWLQRFGSEKIVAAFDIKMINNIPMLATAGWQKQSQISLWDILKTYQATNLKYIICTDIDRDGTLTGPNFSLYEGIINNYPRLAIQASGGITSTNDVRNLKKLGLYGAIIGKALYENKLTLEEALQC